MPLSYILGNLLADVPSAEAVVLLDHEGETIEIFTSRLQPYDVKVQGAYQVIHFQQWEKRFPGLERFYYTGEHYSLFTRRVGDGYYLTVIVGGPAPPSCVLPRMERAKRDLEEKVL
jgi:hypothetical protein